jgi:hypothetical protein
MSRAWMKVAAYVPSCVDITEIIGYVFHPFKKLEAGILASAAVPEQHVLLKGSIFNVLGDAPQQAVHSHTKGPSAIVHCQTCMHGSETNSFSDQVGLSFRIVD